MAFLKLYRKVRGELYFLNNIFESRNIKWGVVTKILCGNEIYLKEIIAVCAKCMILGSVT
jgi:hypothetical protein